MKKIIPALILLLGVAWLATQSPSVGLWVYDQTAKLEAQWYGFSKRTVKLDELELVLYERQAEVAAGEQAPTLVLLHGYTASKELWLRFANHLDAGYRVLIPDLAGHGETGYHPEWSYRATAQADRIAALLHALQIDQAIVAGNSMGGMIAAHFALQYPAQTQALIVLDPAGVTPPQLSETEALFAAGQSPFEIANIGQFMRFYHLTMAQPPFAPEFVLRGVAERYIERRDAYAHIAQDFRLHDSLDERLPQISAPTLIIWGERDRILSASAAPLWQQGITKSELLLLPEIGHMPMVEQPAITAAQVEAFLARRL